MSNRTHAIATAALAVLAAAAGSAYAADPVVDGLLGTDYGSPIITQVNPTQFGDSTLGQEGYASGSELNAAYARVSGGNLYLMLTGNLESNYNHLELFIDSVAGGQHTLVKNNVDIDFNALNRLGENLDGTNPSASTTIGAGLTFDAGFEADYYIGLAGGDNGGQYGAFANFASLPTAGNGTGVFLGGGAGQRVITDINTGIIVAIDNSNTVGVSGTDATNPASAVTGIEYKIPLAAIGNPTNGSIKITAFVNGSGHDYVANQILGSLPSGYGNMGEPRNLDLSTHDGNQYFAVSVAHGPGDVNNDGVVDLTDLNYVLNNFGSTGPNPGDDNGDLVVDLTDLNNVLNNFGSTGAASALAAIPEPASLGLIGLAAVGLLRRRRD